MFDRLYMGILDLSKTASLVIVAVMLGRLLLRRSPKVFSYLLWFAALFRLLCPVAPETPVSIVPTLPSASSGYTLADEPIDFAGAGMAAYQAVGDALNGGLGVQHVATVEKTEDGMTRYVSTDWWSIWILFGKYVWVAGMAAMLIYSGVSYGKIRRKIRIAVPMRDNILIADDIQSPFVIGFLKPKIYLPCNLGEKEQEYIILHEQHHIRRFDHIMKALAFLTLTIHWFNPLVWVAFVFACKDMEMSCDEAVIRKLGSDVRADYSASLLTLATGHRVIAGTPLTFGEGDTKGRIKNLGKWKKPTVWILVFGIILCLILGVCLLTDRVSRHRQHVGTTFYYGNVREQADEGNDAYIRVHCNDGSERVFYYDAEDEDIPEDLTGKPVKVQAKRKEITGNLVTWQVELASNTEFDNLDKAIQSAILNHHSNKQWQGIMDCASFFPYASQSSGSIDPGKLQTVYGIVYHQGYMIEDGRLFEESGCNVPTVLTFLVEDGKYILAEYWEPRDGSYYTDDIKAKYPAFVWPDTQKNLFQQKIAVFRQLTEDFGVDTDLVIAHIIEDICVREQWSNGIENLPQLCQLQFDLLKYYSAETLRYCFSSFSLENPDGARDELGDRVMAYACSEILKSMGQKPDKEWSWQESGRDWFQMFTDTTPEWQRFLLESHPSISFDIAQLKEDIAGITQIRLQNGHNGQYSFITAPEDIRAIMNFVAQVSGKNPVSAKGYYGWTYSLDFMSGESIITSIAFNDDDSFNYGNYGDGYPCRYVLQGITLQDAVSFLCRFDQSNFQWESDYLHSEYDWGISLSVKDVTPTGLTIICKQSRGNITGNLMTGKPYFVQHYENGAWISLEIPQNTVWTTEAYGIPHNGTVQWRVNWKHIYGELAPGSYRIGKSITDFRKTGDYDEAIYYAEFEIAG